MYTLDNFAVYSFFHREAQKFITGWPTVAKLVLDIKLSPRLLILPRLCFHSNSFHINQFLHYEV